MTNEPGKAELFIQSKVKLTWSGTVAFLILPVFLALGSLLLIYLSKPEGSQATQWFHLLDMFIFLWSVFSLIPTGVTLLISLLSFVTSDDSEKQELLASTIKLVFLIFIVALVVLVTSLMV